VNRSLSTSLVWRGFLALAVGVIAVVWPGVTILAVVIIFAIWAFADGFLQAAQAFSSDGAGSVIGHLLLAVVNVVAGVIAIAWPGITAFVLTIWIAIWAVVTGGGEFALAFAADETGGERVLFGLGGLVSIALGLVLFARPRLGAVSLAEVFGLFSLAVGITSLVLAVKVHHTGETISEVLG